jgi:hypothetical protein
MGAMSQKVGDIKARLTAGIISIQMLQFLTDIEAYLNSEFGTCLLFRHIPLNLLHH